MKQYTKKRLTRFVNAFCVKRRHRMVIPVSEVITQFEKYFTEDIEDLISRGAAIFDDIDALMDKHTYSLDSRYQKYRRRIRYKPRGSRILRGQTNIFDFLGDDE